MTMSDLLGDITRDDLDELFDWAEHQEPDCNGSSCGPDASDHSYDCSISTVIRQMDIIFRLTMCYEEANRFVVRVEI